MSVPSSPAPAAACGLGGCTNPVVVQWQRRVAPADPESLPAVQAVFACTQHAMALDLASHVHAPACTAPDLAHLPGCNCTPEPLPTPPPAVQTVTLSTGWTVSAS
ncbi:hypothetical protein ABH930_000340 [Kitasatospora sp. GAS204A]|nr:hypothetical protein [Kitasatospora sp. GAS204B]